jgi:hypothetical protein
VSVAIGGFKLLPYQPGASAADNRVGAGHWRLAVDGHNLSDNLGSATITYTRYLAPGTHWIAAELSNADSSSLRPAVWSEPVVLHVPRVIRCWPTGWRGTPGHGNPRFTCRRRAGEAREGSRKEASLAIPRKLTGHSDCRYQAGGAGEEALVAAVRRHACDTHRMVLSHDDALRLIARAELDHPAPFAGSREPTGQTPKEGK